MRVVITGASGMVGRGVLMECLESPRIEKVLTVNRRDIGEEHPKHSQLILSDLSDAGSHQNTLKGYDACFFCAGVSSLGMSEEEYTAITYELTLKFAQVFLDTNPGSTFCYVSGTGTDSSEKGRVMWARVKGRTENELLRMPFKAAYMFRPGYIQPMKGIRSRTSHYQLFYNIFRPIYGLIKGIPGWATNTTNVGKAMINTVLAGGESAIMGNREINTAAKLQQ